MIHKVPLYNTFLLYVISSYESYRTVLKYQWNLTMLPLIPKKETLIISQTHKIKWSSANNCNIQREFFKTRFSRCKLHSHNAAIGSDWNLFFCDNSLYINYMESYDDSFLTLLFYVKILLSLIVYILILTKG